MSPTARPIYTRRETEYSEEKEEYNGVTSLTRRLTSRMGTRRRKRRSTTKESVEYMRLSLCSGCSQLSTYSIVPVIMTTVVTTDNSVRS